MVVTVAHCVAYMDDVKIHFGESADGPDYTEEFPSCTWHGDGDWVEASGGTWSYYGKDIAFCKLNPGHPTPPYQPVMVPNGCEAQYARDVVLGPDAELYGFPIELVASGLEGEMSDTSGNKRAAPGGLWREMYNATTGDMRVYSMLPEMEDGWQMGIDPLTVFGGDSGGPAYFQLLNGSWRVVGLNANPIMRLDNFGDGLGQIARRYVMSTSLPRYLRWIERTSMVDISPCHDWVGGKWVYAWNSSCGAEYDTSPDASSSDWPACTSGTVSSSTACSGWTPPNPDNKKSPSEADAILRLALNGPGPFPDDSLWGEQKLPQWDGTGGNDSLVWSGNEATEVFGGRGHDSLFVGVGADELHGGVGDDLLYGGSENDVIVPGRGLDYVQGDGGSDRIIIRGTCEVVAGEVIDGGAGADTLYSPVNAAGLAARGVTLISVESVVVNHPALETGTCAGGSQLF
jgi:hypothetical protein